MGREREYGPVRSRHSIGICISWYDLERTVLAELVSCRAHGVLPHASFRSSSRIQGNGRVLKIRRISSRKVTPLRSRVDQAPVNI